MGSPASVTDYLAVLKTIWPQSEIEDLFYKDMPFLAMVAKDTSWVGDNRVIALQYGKTNGRSATFSNAKANKKASKFAKMTIETSDNFSLFSIDHKTIQLSRNDKGTLARALTTETKSAIDKLKRITGAQLWNNGGGSIGTVKTGSISGNTFQFADPLSARLVEPGDIINGSTDDGTGGAGILPGALEVADVSTDLEGSQAGLITCTSAVSGITGITNGTHIFIDGDYGAWLSGVPAYITSVTPGTGSVPASIWGMDRTKFPSRLAGIRVNGAGLSIKEAVKKALVAAKLQSADITHLFMHPENWNDLDNSLDSNRRYVDTKVGNVGFTGISFSNNNGSPVEVYEDPDMPVDVCYGINLPSWTLASAGELADFMTLPGQAQMRPEESTNSFEGRIGNYAQLYTDAPGKNFRLALA